MQMTIKTPKKTQSAAKWALELSYHMITGARKKTGTTYGGDSKEQAGIMQLPIYKLILFVMEWYQLVFAIWRAQIKPQRASRTPLSTHVFVSLE